MFQVTQWRLRREYDIDTLDMYVNKWLPWFKSLGIKACICCKSFPSTNHGLPRWRHTFAVFREGTEK